MALPFLIKKATQAPTITDVMHESAADDHSAPLEACAHDILAAIKRNDASALAEALKAAFEVCESSPHVEGEHLNESGE